MKPRPDSFCKYMTPEVGKILLTSRTIRWSSPLCFNDPFDFYFHIGFRFDLDEVREPLLRRYAEAVYAEKEPAFFPNSPEAVWIKRLRSVRNNISRESFENELLNGIDTLIKSFTKTSSNLQKEWLEEAKDWRILCVAEDPDNLLMWSHYAANHTGLVVRIKCSEADDGPLCAAKPVQYSAISPGICSAEEFIETAVGLRPRGGDTLFYDLAYTKSNVWAYEREWRVMTKKHVGETGDVCDEPLYPTEIEAVYLGCRMSKSNREQLILLLNGDLAHVSVYQAHRKKHQYGLDWEKVN